MDWGLLVRWIWWSRKGLCPTRLTVGDGKSPRRTKRSLWVVITGTGYATGTGRKLRLEETKSLFYGRLLLALTKDLGDGTGVFLIGAGHAEGAVAGGVDDLGVIKAEAVGDGGV